MDTILFIIFTAFAVSIDSFFGGYSVGINKGTKLYPVIVAFITMFLCLIANIVGIGLVQYFDGISIIGNATLFCVGIGMIFTKKEENSIISKEFRNIVLATCVALDGAIATFSLTIMGYTSLLVPLTVSLMHFLCTGVGMIASSHFFESKNSNVFAGIVVIFLSIIRFFG